MRRIWIALTLLAGCGDDLRPKPTGCVARFSGNFDETAESAESCAAIVPGTATTLAISVPSKVLDEPLAVEVDLGPTPIVGHYSSVTVQRWSVRGSTGNKACLIAGGSDLARRGTFALDVSAIDVATGTVEGTLTLELAVLQTPFQVCGANLIERITVEL